MGLSPVAVYKYNGETTTREKRLEKEKEEGEGEAQGEERRRGYPVGWSPSEVYTRTVRSVARVQDHNAISTVGSNCRGRERAYFA